MLLLSLPLKKRGVASLTPRCSGARFGVNILRVSGPLLPIGGEAGGRGVAPRVPLRLGHKRKGRHTVRAVVLYGVLFPVQFVRLGMAAWAGYD